MSVEMKLNTNNEIEITEGGRWVYAVELDRCKTSAQALDWIIQVSKKKGWATDAVLGRLVKLMDKELDIQRNLCSFAMGDWDATSA